LETIREVTQTTIEETIEQDRSLLRPLRIACENSCTPIAASANLCEA
jgi:hypothetical protein